MHLGVFTTSYREHLMSLKATKPHPFPKGVV